MLQFLKKHDWLRQSPGPSLRPRPATAPRPRHCAPAPPPHPGPVTAPRPVIARNEAIHRRSYNSMDCHGAARLAMTEGAAIAPRPFTARPRPVTAPRPVIARNEAIHRRLCNSSIAAA